MKRPRCAACGRFVGYRTPAKVTPDSQFGPERIEWICRPCRIKETA